MLNQQVLRSTIDHLSDALELVNMLTAEAWDKMDHSHDQDVSYQETDPENVKIELAWDILFTWQNHLNQMISSLNHLVE